MSLLGSLIDHFVPIVRAEEEEEEAELVDPQKILRERCSELAKCAALKQKLNTCNDRVNSRSETTETCTEEVIDYMSCIDHCAAKTLFSKLK